MVLLRWPNNWRFTDRKRGEKYDGPVTTEVADDAEDEYLDRGWEYPDDEEAEVESDDDEDYEDPPSDRDTLEEMSYDQLRKYAAESDQEDIDGGSKKQDIIDAFAANED